MGYGWVNAIRRNDQAYADRDWQEAVASEPSIHAEFRLRASDGSYPWTKVRAIPLRDQNGRIEKWIGIKISIYVSRPKPP